MKRERSDYEESIKNFDIAKCLMILSQTSMVNKQIGMNQLIESSTSNRFECKTCNRRFPSFQALGGHRASHKKPKPSVEQKDNVKHLSNNNHDKGNHMHECSICGQKFGTGQALGGHMRRHRSTMTVESPSFIPPVIPTMPVLKRCSSSKRVLFLDLNLTPLENDLEHIFGKTFVPKIDMKFVI